MKVLVKLLIINVLCGCGAPGSDAVFTKGNPKLDTARAKAAQEAARPQPARATPKRYEGLYKRSGEDSRFQPCGTTIPLTITGSGEARYLLHERFRWSSFWQGQDLYAVLWGSVVTDTPQVNKADSASGLPRTRFFLTAVDSLRNWNRSDCGGKLTP